MTSDEIRDMARNSEGLELDAAVLVCLFGWQWVRVTTFNLCGLVPPADSEFKRVNWCPLFNKAVAEWPKPVERFCDWSGSFCRNTPRPSTNIADAWKVFERGLMLTGNAGIEADMENFGRGTFSRGTPDGVVTAGIGEWHVTGPVCVAICRAALLAYADTKESQDAE